MQPLAHSRPQTFPQSPEALDAVLGRFQEWTASRKVIGDHGLREVSYEDAVYANRRSRRPATPSKDTPTKDMKDARLRSKTSVMPAKTPITAQPVKIQSIAVESIPVPPIADQRSKPRRKTTRQAAIAKTGAKSRIKNGAETVAAKPTPQPSFKTVLAETLAPASSPATPTVALTHSRPAEAERQVTLSLRLAPGEQALIRARAAVAGVSTSAYLRQCVLEVEQMRQTLALIGQSAAIAVSNQTQQTQPSMQAPQPGFLDLLKQVFFAGRRSRNLSLRA